MKLRDIFKYFSLACAVAFLIHLSFEPLYTPTALPTDTAMFRFPKVIAHKSVISGGILGNSLEAIQEALSSNVDGIEVDVRVSKDGVFFLYHGDMLEEYTDAEGRVEDLNWEQLSGLRYKGDIETYIIKLEDFLKLVGNQKFIFLDIKSDKIWNEFLAKNLANLIKSEHLEESVFVESFNPFFLISMRLKDRDIMLMYDFVQNTNAIGEESQAQFDKIPWLLKQSFFQKQVRRIVRPDVLGPRFNTDEAVMKDLIYHNYPLIVWTVDDLNTAKELYDIGVQGIQTNNSLKFLEYLPQKKKYSYDAGGTKTLVDEIVPIHTIDDIVDAINKAKETGKQISIAGRRHSMGGQSSLEGALQLDLLPLNKVTYNKSTKTVTVQAGATWKKVRKILNERNRSVSVMQSDDIFTVGGSISVNVHGWQVGSAPISSTIVSMKIINSEGEVKTVSHSSGKELFEAIIGGYGLFGVIVEVELNTHENSTLEFNTLFTSPNNLENIFEKKITKNSRAELAYARLSVDQSSLFDEAGLFWFEKTLKNQASSDIKPESLVAVKRAVFRVSQYNNLGKKVRWSAEKIYSKTLANSKNTISRNNAMNTDIHILWPLYGKNKDILHEYFVPKGKLSVFIEALKDSILKYNINVLNVTIREVKQDSISSLKYASKDVFALVCLFSQEQSKEKEEIMEQFTKVLIEEVLKVEGTFYLPYRLHYEKQHLLRAYPDIEKWLALKKKYDPDFLFNNQFYQHIEKLMK